MEFDSFQYIIICGIIAAIVILLFIIAEWKILTKAGEKGWKSLIPGYNIFVSHHIVGMSHIWFILEVITWIIELVFEISGAIPKPVVFWTGIAVGIFTLLSEFIHILKMCDCFGKNIWFKVGMVFLPNLFTLIIAFGKSEYIKPKH